MDEACTLLLPYRVMGAWVGGAGVSPAVLRRDGRAKIASETPPNPALRSKVSGHRAQRIRGGLPLSEGRRKPDRPLTQSFPGSPGPTYRGRRLPRMCFDKIRATHPWVSPPPAHRRTSRKTRSSVCCRKLLRAALGDRQIRPVLAQRTHKMRRPSFLL